MLNDRMDIASKYVRGATKETVDILKELIRSSKTAKEQAEYEKQLQSILLRKIPEKFIQDRNSSLRNVKETLRHNSNIKRNVGNDIHDLIRNNDSLAFVQSKLKNAPSSSIRAERLKGRRDAVVLDVIAEALESKDGFEETVQVIRNFRDKQNKRVAQKQARLQKIFSDDERTMEKINDFVTGYKLDESDIQLGQSKSKSSWATTLGFDSAEELQELTGMDVDEMWEYLQLERKGLEFGDDYSDLVELDPFEGFGFKAGDAIDSRSKLSFDEVVRTDKAANEINQLRELLFATTDDDMASRVYVNALNKVLSEQYKLSDIPRLTPSGVINAASLHNQRALLKNVAFDFYAKTSGLVNSEGEEVLGVVWSPRGKNLPMEHHVKTIFRQEAIGVEARVPSVLRARTQMLTSQEMTNFVTRAGQAMDMDVKIAEAITIEGLSSFISQSDNPSFLLSVLHPEGDELVTEFVEKLSGGSLWSKDNGGASISASLIKMLNSDSHRDIARTILSKAVEQTGAAYIEELTNMVTGVFPATEDILVETDATRKVFSVGDATDRFLEKFNQLLPADVRTTMPSGKVRVRDMGAERLKNQLESAVNGVAKKITKAKTFVDANKADVAQDAAELGVRTVDLYMEGILRYIEDSGEIVDPESLIKAIKSIGNTGLENDNLLFKAWGKVADVYHERGGIRNPDQHSVSFKEVRELMKAELAQESSSPRSAFKTKAKDLLSRRKAGDNTMYPESRNKIFNEALNILDQEDFDSIDDFMGQVRGQTLAGNAELEEIRTTIFEAMAELESQKAGRGYLGFDQFFSEVDGPEWLSLDANIGEDEYGDPVTLYNNKISAIRNEEVLDGRTVESYLNEVIDSKLGESKEIDKASEWFARKTNGLNLSDELRERVINTLGDIKYEGPVTLDLIDSIKKGLINLSADRGDDFGWVTAGEEDLKQAYGRIQEVLDGRRFRTEEGYTEAKRAVETYLKETIQIEGFDISKVTFTRGDIDLESRGVHKDGGLSELVIFHGRRVDKEGVEISDQTERVVYTLDGKAKSLRRMDAGQIYALVGGGKDVSQNNLQGMAVSELNERLIEWGISEDQVKDMAKATWGDTTSRATSKEIIQAVSSMSRADKGGRVDVAEVLDYIDSVQGARQKKLMPLPVVDAFLMGATQDDPNLRDAFAQAIGNNVGNELAHDEITRAMNGQRDTFDVVEEVRGNMASLKKAIQQTKDWYKESHLSEIAEMWQERTSFRRGTSVIAAVAGASAVYSISKRHRSSHNEAILQMDRPGTEGVTRVMSNTDGYASTVGSPREPYVVGPTATESGFDISSSINIRDNVRTISPSQLDGMLTGDSEF